MKFQAIPAMLSMIPSAWSGLVERDLERIKSMVRLAFPSVAQLSTAQLAQWLDEPEPSLLLIDVRSPEEFAVSHLRGALNLRKVEQIAGASKDSAKTILYCSVGFRSSRVAALLALQGVKNILNLEGSIFQWANEGRLVYQGAKPVLKVHPYGKRWAGLLKPGLAS